MKKNFAITIILVFTLSLLPFTTAYADSDRLISNDDYSNAYSGIPGKVNFILIGGLDDYEVLSAEESELIDASGGWSEPTYAVWNVGQVISMAALAVSISCAISGIPIGNAYNIASQIIAFGASFVYGRTGISWKYDSQYQYCKRVTTFYSNSACTNYICGPYQVIQKKSINSGASINDDDNE